MLLRQALVAVICLSGAVVNAQNASSDLFATHGRYRVQPGDVIDVQYRYTPEFNQTVTIQPDGFVALQVAGEVRVIGMTLEEARLEIVKRSETRLRDPEVALGLKEFEKPYFIVGGHVAKPGKFELRAPTNALEAIAIAGGFTSAAKHSQVLLIHRIDLDHAEVRAVDLKRIERDPKQADEWPLAAGDMLIVPQNAVSKIERIVKWSSIGVFWNPITR